MKNMFARLESGLKTPVWRMVLLLLITFLFGAFAAFWARFALVKKADTHYHANFAVYINGQREEFESFAFYEEVSSCTGDMLNDPHTRTHMHDRINHVVHVHDKAATWGHFFANLGFVLGNKVLATSTTAYVDGQDGKDLNFYLNGKAVSSVANEVINSEDVLLIEYGVADDAILAEHYNEITKDAAEYNKRQDPSSCQGGKPESFTERVKRTLGIDESH